VEVVQELEGVVVSVAIELTVWVLVEKRVIAFFFTEKVD